ncbi:hypothetical protein SteCoe_5182 [Stentor coeruleus]|uniref:Uncharacterized protein n=1 Tax=Stentor coeruleus TaxID=5963 RepID=A0A1R2CSV0_9CILI|nr:hypothetical protein SteCoe_5182 [Stentor coeruleus]
MSRQNSLLKSSSGPNLNNKEKIKQSLLLQSSSGSNLNSKEKVKQNSPKLKSSAASIISFANTISKMQETHKAKKAAADKYSISCFTEAGKPSNFNERIRILKEDDKTKHLIFTIEKKDSEIKEANKKIQEIIKKNSEQQTKIKEAYAEIEKVKNDAGIKIMKGQSKQREEIIGLKNENEMLKKTLNLCTDIKNKNKEKVKNLKEEKEKINQKFEEEKSKTKKLEDKIEKLKKKINESNEIIKKNKEEMSELCNTIDEKKEKIEKLNKTIQEQKNLMIDADKNLHKLDTENKKYKEIIEQGEKQRNQDEIKINSLTNELSNYKKYFSCNTSPVNVMNTEDTENSMSRSRREPTPINRRVRGQSRDVKKTQKK